MSYIARPGLFENSPPLSRRVIQGVRTRDAMMTYDGTVSARTADSTGAWLEGQLERLDQKLHEPLVAVTWGRDVDLREDVSIGDEFSSFTNSTFVSPGGTTPTGKSWIGKNTDTITGVDLDISKTAQPLFLWGKELRWTIPELESSMRLGRPVDQQKYNAMLTNHQMDIDEQVYIGDTGLGYFGMLNNPNVQFANVANGASGFKAWSTKTPDEILADVNSLLMSIYQSSGFAIVPSELRLPPVQFGYLISQKVSTAGNVSIIEFLRNNSIANSANGQPLNIQPIKWLTGRGAGGTDRMFAYTKDPDRVRFPMTTLQRTPMEWRSIWQITTYFCRLGVIEWVYPETAGARDGI